MALAACFGFLTYGFGCGFGLLALLLAVDVGL